MTTILVTGNCGFIGFHLANTLLEKGYQVVGVDNLNDYYDVKLKKERLNILKQQKNFLFYLRSIEEGLEDIFTKHDFQTVIHLAAQAGVRYSIENPHAYIQANVVGFMNILESCRKHNIPHLIYASSSSVYGANEKTPFSTKDNTDYPVSLYAATKKANELMAHTYSYLYGLHTTGLRFFTVYGTWGRPDMSYFIFTKAILDGQPIKVFNEGKMLRDFTYIDDIVTGIIRFIEKKPRGVPPYKLYNLGNSQPILLLDFISTLEEKLGKKAKKEFLPIQSGDVIATFADISDLEKDINFRPKTSIDDGLERFVKWYRDYYAK